MFTLIRSGNIASPLNERITNVLESSLERYSATEIALRGLSKGWLQINREIVNISSPLTVHVLGGLAANLITSTGADAAVLPALATNYNVYASNSLATFAPLSVRLSSTVPTDGYLGASGNAANWLHVGVCHVPAASFEKWNVCGYRSQALYTTIDLNVVAVLLANVYASIKTLTGIALLPFHNLRVSCAQNIQNSVITGVYLRMVGTAPSKPNTFRGDTANTSHTGCNIYLLDNRDYGLMAETVDVQMATSTAATLTAFADRSNMSIERFI